MSVQDVTTGRLLARNAMRLRAFVRTRVRNEADADDISQEAQVRVLARSNASPVKDPVAYAFRVALNLVSDRGRAEALAFGEEIDDNLPSAEPSPFDALDMKQRVDLYARALRGMPHQRREVFVLRQSENLTYPQIAERLKISVEAAQKHYSRAANDVRRAVSMERGG